MFTQKINGPRSQAMVQTQTQTMPTITILSFETMTAVSGSAATQVFGAITTSNGLSIEILSPNQSSSPGDILSEALMVFYGLLPREVFTA